MKNVTLSFCLALQALAFPSHAQDSSQPTTQAQPELSAQNQNWSLQQSANHRILLLGGAGLIQQTNQPKFDAFLRTIGFGVANDLKDKLRAQKLYVASYIPPQRLPAGEFQSNVATIIAKCACTMMVQFTLRVADSSLKFKFEAMELIKNADDGGVTPQTRWEMEKSYFPSQASMDAAVLFEITREVAADLTDRQVFVRK